MTLTFGSLANLDSEFRTTVAVFGFIVVILVAAFSLRRRDSALALWQAAQRISCALRRALLSCY